MSLDKPSAGETLASARHRELHRVISVDSTASEDQIAVYKREIRLATTILNLAESPLMIFGTSIDGWCDYDPEGILYPYLSDDLDVNGFMRT